MKAMIIVVGALTLLHVYPVLVGECVDAVGEIEVHPLIQSKSAAHSSGVLESMAQNAL